MATSLERHFMMFAARLSAGNPPKYYKGLFGVIGNPLASPSDKMLGCVQIIGHLQNYTGPVYQVSTIVNGPLLCPITVTAGTWGVGRSCFCIHCSPV
jgi:hypothetical protein